MSQSVAPYAAYQSASCAGVTPNGPKTTNEPVEALCINCESKMLPVARYALAIKTRTAVRIDANAKKNGTKSFPCGLAAPRKSATGRCQSAQRIPMSKLGQPFSSSKPAGSPKNTPIQKWFGEYAGETKPFSK